MIRISDNKQINITNDGLIITFDDIPRSFGVSESKHLTQKESEELYKNLKEYYENES